MLNSGNLSELVTSVKEASDIKEDRKPRWYKLSAMDCESDGLTLVICFIYIVLVNFNAEIHIMAELSNVNVSFLKCISRRAAAASTILNIFLEPVALNPSMPKIGTY
jgi:hypothetical protein